MLWFVMITRNAIKPAAGTGNKAVKFLDFFCAFCCSSFRDPLFVISRHQQHLASLKRFSGFSSCRPRRPEQVDFNADGFLRLALDKSSDW
jgi:hypothetical protein